MTLMTVFGGTGFLGRRIVERLTRDGATVRVAMRHPDRADVTRVTGFLWDRGRDRLWRQGIDLIGDDRRRQVSESIEDGAMLGKSEGGEFRYYGATATDLSIQHVKTRPCGHRIISSAPQPPTYHYLGTLNLCTRPHLSSMQLGTTVTLP